MASKLEKMLKDFEEDDYTVKLCRAIFAIVPGGPDFEFYDDLEGAITRVMGEDAIEEMSDDEYDEFYESVESLTESEQAEAVLWAVDKMDTADKGIGIYTGLKNLSKIFQDREEGERTYEADPQQATDAVLKALTLVYLVHKLYEGGTKEKIKHFLNVPAGAELAVYFGAAEIALPFTDNLVMGGAKLVRTLIDKFGDDSAAAKFADIMGGEAADQSRQAVVDFVEPLGKQVDRAEGKIDKIIAKVKEHLPSAATIANVSDSATGVVATGTDLMPVWRFLGARLVAETCVYAASAARDN